jgi:hypothetical protein
LGAKEGLALRQWVDGAKQLDPEVERARNTLLSITGDGLAAVSAQWDTLAAKTKKALGQPFIDMARSSAEEFDRQASERGAKEEDLYMSSGSFNPLERAEPERVPAHESAQQHGGDGSDPFN